MFLSVVATKISPAMSFFMLNGDIVLTLILRWNKIPGGIFSVFLLHRKFKANLFSWGPSLACMLCPNGFVFPELFLFLWNSLAKTTFQNWFGEHEGYILSMSMTDHQKSLCFQTYSCGRNKLLFSYLVSYVLSTLPWLIRIPTQGYMALRGLKARMYFFRIYFFNPLNIFISLSQSILIPLSL